MGQTGSSNPHQRLTIMTPQISPSTLAFKKYAWGAGRASLLERRPDEAKHPEFCPRSDDGWRPSVRQTRRAVAVFDNDGTLWSEQPLYFQFAFMLDRMKAMAPQHPEWKDNPLFSAVLQGDMKTVAAGGVTRNPGTCTVTHAGMTTTSSQRSWRIGSQAPGIQNSTAHTRT